MANPLEPIAEQPQPSYDRNADIVWYRGVEPKLEDQFIRSLPDLKLRKNKQQVPEMTFFKKIPVSIRLKIYSFVFEYPANGKQVNLSKDFTTKDVFPPDFFVSPWDILQHVEGALSACVQMRDELFTYFWSTYHFHVTFSPYSIGAVFSGLSVRLLNAYAMRVNHLTVEIDMTKLVFSVAKDAKLLKENNRKMQKVINTLVFALERHRCKGTYIASLSLLARRYQGFRPAPADSPEDKVPYCPDKALLLFNVFCQLKGLVLQCRMSGFSIPYTRALLKRILLPPFLTKPRPAPVIPAWPNYNPNRPQVVYLSNINTAADVGSAPGTPILSSTIATAGSSPGTPNTIAASTTGSVEMPGGRTTVPSFGYSQAGSSTESLAPPKSQTTGFYQVQKDTPEDSNTRSSGNVQETPSIGSDFEYGAGIIAPGTSSRRPSRGSPISSTAPYGGSYIADEAGNPIIANQGIHASTPGFMITLPGGPYMTDEAGIPIVYGDSFSTSTPASFAATPGFSITPRRGPYMTKEANVTVTHEDDASASPRSSTSSARMIIPSFGTARVITASQTAIPIPRRGSGRSFQSRHGYIVNFKPPGTLAPITPESSVSLSLSFGHDIPADTETGSSCGSSSFAGEVDAEMARRQQDSHPTERVPLPPRKDSLPGAAAGSKSPSTIHELNEMNAMDPAFARAVQGLRRASDA